MNRRLFISLLLLCTLLTASAQTHRVNKDGSNAALYDDGETYIVRDDDYGSYTDGAGNRTTWGRDTTKHKNEKPIPIGQFQWVLEPRLGTVVDAENNDTVVHDFQKWNATDGYTGEYNYLANISSPRLSRLYFNRDNTSDEFLFLQPYSFFRGSLQDFRFTNTKSPITNLAYHSCGNRQTGEDRVRGYFATNINKLAGLGFKIDYSYGVGYYYAQPSSMFGSTFYGYYRGERYNIHAYIGVNHMKMGENGGIEDDRYIEDPYSLGQSYDSRNIPTMLDQTWNRNHEQHAYLSHRYNMGFTRVIEVPDSLKPTPPSAAELLSDLPDSIQTVLRGDTLARRLAIDSLMQVWQGKQEIPKEFIPVTSIIHTFELSNLKHEYLSHNTTKDYYTDCFYGDGNKMADLTKALSVRNTFGIALREGFNKWAQMGITLFGTHKLRTYQLMDGQDGLTRYTENDISVGGELARTQGSRFHFNTSAEVWLVGEHVGDLNIDGKTNLQLRLGRRDSLFTDVHVNFMHRKPTFFFRHYHSQICWWDNDDLSREVRLKIDGTLRLKKLGTKLQVGFENVSNYTYFGMQNTLHAGKSATSIIPTDYSHAVDVMQTGSVQVFGATLAQDLHWKFIHWDNQVSYQTSSNQDALPLPKLNIYTNLYLLFRIGIAKVLRVQIGGDMRFFTSYYAPDYSPAIQQFAVQDTNFERVNIGGYPIVGVYANMHLKHCRLYVSARHVNAGSGHSFLVPHYPINPLTIHFGLSWNFFN
ncbi:MAG: putative porin [Bacteroidaceae bacterium]|nr:putative porin [Bacteroidaceae bacterium]